MKKKQYTFFPYHAANKNLYMFIIILFSYFCVPLIYIYYFQNFLEWIEKQILNMTGCLKEAFNNWKQMWVRNKSREVKIIFVLSFLYEYYIRAFFENEMRNWTVRVINT